MISVVVGTRHLRAIFGYRRGHRLDKILRQTLEPLVGVPFPKIESKKDLASFTVFEVLKEFYERAVNRLKADPAEIISAHQAEIVRVAREEYHYPGFECSIDDACRSVAIHGIFPHGSIPQGNERLPVYLPDFSLGVRCYGCFGRPQEDDRIEELSGNQHVHDLSKLECHLCDSLLTVYERADRYWKELNGARRGDGSDFWTDLFLSAKSRDAEWLIIGAIVNGFQGLRSIRRDNPAVMALANHRLLAGKATRQGLGKPVVSGLFPIDLWRKFEPPVQHFILEAAEQVGAMHCPPVYPNLPSETEMRQLCGAAEMAAGDCGFDLDVHGTSLKKLGIKSTVRRRIKQYPGRLERGEWAWDWTLAIHEFQSAFYDEDIEQSLHLQSVLDLYPLHKRILGLIEYVFINKIEAKGFEGRASELWTKAFTGRPEQKKNKKLTRKSLRTLCEAMSSSSCDLDLLATLETEGNWAIIAGSQATTSQSSPIRLSVLLDDLILRICEAGEVTGVPITLHPSTPQEHLSQLSRLAEPNNAQAACMTLYLGKVALMLRNAIEHGNDTVTEDSLRVDCSGYWKQLRAGKAPHLWLKDKAAREPNGKGMSKDWRFKSDLPDVLPQLANEFLLNSVSLERCLVLLSLAIYGGLSQLKL